MWITTVLIPRLTITSFSGAFLTVVALAMVNATIWDAALFFKIPDVFTTHALVLLTANGFVFWLLVKLLPGIEVRGLAPAIAAPVVFSIVSLFINEYLKDVDWIALLGSGLDALSGLRDNLLQSGGAAQ